MFRSVFTVGGFTLMSRILGFVRDKLIANYLGAGPLGDVWVAAFTLPNLFRRVFGEGAFNAAFVPMYSRRLEAGGEEVAGLFARRVISVMAVILIILFVICFIFMEQIVKGTNWGFESGGRLEPAVEASRVTIGYLVLICLVAAVSGILNSRRIFGAPAFAYVVLNIVFIAALVAVIPFTGQPIKILTWTVLVAGGLQLAVVVVACVRRGINLTPRTPLIDADIKRLGVLMAPGLVSAGIQQLNLIVGGAVASLEVGGKTLIYFSDRINQLPLGLIGMAFGVVLLPEISRSVGAKDEDAARKSLLQGIEMSMLLCLPAMIAMIVIPREIMYAIFEGGKFEGKDAIEAGRVLQAFAIGTPAYVLARVLQPGYFAREDTRTPMRFTIITALVNMALVWPLFKWLGPTGCALATSLAGWVNVFLLWMGLGKLDYLRLKPGNYSRLARMFFCAVVMGVVIWFLTKWANPYVMAEGRFFFRVGVISVLVAVGVVVYFAFVFAIRIMSVADLKRALRRPRS